VTVAGAGVDLAGARVLITGGAGLVGSTIADRLAGEQPGEVRVLDDFSRGRMANLASAMERYELHVIDGDIKDPAQVRAAVDGIDVVFHQAAIRITQCAQDPRLAVETLGMGTFNVLEAAVAAGVKKVVAASSASVYGQASELPTTETHHPYANRTIYGAAKVFNEGMLRSFNEMYGLPYVALRYFNVYGPRMDIHGVYTEVMVRWMERIAAGLPPVILGDGTQTMDFVFIDDIARANLAAATADVTDDVFNVASGTSTSLNELAAALVQVMGSDLQPEYGPPRDVAHVQSRQADISHARDRLGFVAETSLTEGLEQLVAWWRAEQGSTTAAAI
jgi:UDP-glucose 4-epimerase